MLTERLRMLLALLEGLSADEQDEVAAAIEEALRTLLVTSDAVRPAVLAAALQVMDESAAILAYLRDR